MFIQLGAKSSHIHDHTTILRRMRFSYTDRKRASLTTKEIVATVSLMRDKYFNKSWQEWVVLTETSVLDIAVHSD